eukprot:SAG31_NODE_3005_length_4795_cov_2.671210_1_plen_386_part_00
MSEIDSDLDSESSDDDVKQRELENEIQQLTQDIRAYPYNYDGYIALIAAQRKAGDLEAVRTARTSMASIFPLTYQIWTGWLEDEKRLAATTAERSKVLELYARAVQDYLCIPLWLDYLEYAEEILPEDEAGAIYEAAITAAGMHFALASEIWAAYRAFERKIASRNKNSDMQNEGADGNPNTSDRLHQIFIRQVVVPMQGIGSVWAEWDSLPGRSVYSQQNIQKQYEAALQAAGKRERFENAVLDEQNAHLPTAQQIESWLKYARFEMQQRPDARDDSKKNTQRVVCVFERAVGNFPLCLRLWREYLSYVDQVERDGKRLVEVYRRAVRNVAWSGKLMWPLVQLHAKILKRLKLEENICIWQVDSGAVSLQQWKNMDVMMRAHNR